MKNFLKPTRVTVISFIILLFVAVLSAALMFLAGGPVRSYYYDGESPTSVAIASVASFVFSALFFPVNTFVGTLSAESIFFLTDRMPEWVFYTLIVSVYLGYLYLLATIFSWLWYKLKAKNAYVDLKLIN